MESASAYPSIGLAYETIKSSYEVMERRFEAANARIQNLLTWAIGLTSAIPIFAKAIIGDGEFNSLWLLPVLLAFSALVIVGIIAYRTGGIKLIHPKNLFEEYIQYSELEYKKWIVYWAGKHFDTNQEFINTKSRYIDIMTVLLGLEVAFLILWIIVS
jgi:hypothetical protein